MNDEPKNKTVAETDTQSTESQQKWLMDRIPVVSDNETVILPKQFFKILTDEQFRILVEKIQLNFVVGIKTQEYIKRRMRKLGLDHRKYINKQSSEKSN